MQFTTSVRHVSKPWLLLDRLSKGNLLARAEREYEKIAMEMTSGTTSTAELRRMGHPFSRRRPQNVPRLPINRQSGDLQKAIRIVRRVRHDGEEIFLQVNSPHASVLAKGGTAKMVPRGFLEEFAKRTKGILRNNVVKAFRKK